VVLRWIGTGYTVGTTAPGASYPLNGPDLTVFTNVVEEEFPEVHIQNTVWDRPYRPYGSPGACYKPPSSRRIKRLRA
jgi:hypothetical protein